MLDYIKCVYNNNSGAGNNRTLRMYSNKKEYKPVNDKAIIPLTIHQINT